MHDREGASPGQPACHRHHVLLGNPALDEAIRILLREGHETAVLHEIRVEYHEVGVAVCLQQQRVAVGADEILCVTRLASLWTSAALRREGSQAAGVEEACGVLQQLL